MYKDQSGQMLPVVAFMMVTLLGLAGIVTDFGHALFSYRELQASTNAAALAAAAGLPNQTTASSYATSYSSASGKNNAYSNLTLSGSPLVSFKCVTSMSGLAGCITDTGGGSTTANAVQVIQRASVPTTFLGLLGLKAMPIAATATAAMRGAPTVQYNVAIIVDATRSMSDTDSDSQCNNTRLSCALTGLRILLQDLTPCTSSGCGTLSSGNYAHALDRVSLFTFPNVTTGTVSHDYCSGGSSTPTPSVYTFPTSSSSSWSSGYSPTGSTYQITPFSSDYQTTSSSTGVPTGTLSTTSNLSIAAGANSSSCAGMSNPGGEGTYYAGVIYAAQAALTAEQALPGNSGSQNVMILLSDGDATSTQSQMGSSATNSGTYPSYNHECQQAVTAAQAATAAGTTVYAVAYGATSSGCSSDVSPYNSPCYTMQHIASSSTTFFSDYTATGGSSTCVASSRPTTQLNQIFSYIAGDFSHARLIPNGST